MARASDTSLYTGISTDVDKRMEQHNSGKGSRYLRAKRPAELVYKCELGDKSLALRAEYRLKNQPQETKIGILYTNPCKDALLKLLKLAENQ